MDERERHSSGMQVRRAVLGDAHVDRAEAAKDTFSEPFQDLITRYAWGEIWSRPGLSRHTRSLLTLSMMIALNRADEFRMHVRAALNNQVRAGDPGSAAAKRHLLRRPGSQRRISYGAGSLRRD